MVPPLQKTENAEAFLGCLHQFDPAIGPIAMFAYRYFIDPVMFMLTDVGVALSDGLTHELQQHLSSRMKAKIVTKPVFVFADEVYANAHAPIEAELEYLADQPVIVTWGRIAREKGVVDIIRVFAKTRAFISETRLVVIGDGPELNVVMNSCTQFGLSCPLDHEESLQRSKRLQAFDATIVGPQWTDLIKRVRMTIVERWLVFGCVKLCAE